MALCVNESKLKKKRLESCETKYSQVSSLLSVYAQTRAYTTEEHLDAFVGKVRDEQKAVPDEHEAPRRVEPARARAVLAKHLPAPPPPKTPPPAYHKRERERDRLKHTNREENKKTGDLLFDSF
jgi:hypothetical protein